MFKILICVCLLAESNLRSEQSDIEKAGQLWWKGEFKNAARLYIKAMHDKENEFSGRINLATLFRSIGDYRSAVNQYKKIVSTTTPSNLEEIKYIYLPLAETYYYLHQLSEAEEIFKNILSVYPNYHAALFGLGRVLFAQGILDESARILRRAAKKEPGFPGSYIYLARIAEKRNELKDAADFYSIGLKKDNHQVELYYFKGQNYQAQGRSEEAYKQYHRLENIDAKNSYVLAKINELLPELKKKPEEIISAKVLEKFSSLRRIAEPEMIPVIRIGLNTIHKGRILGIEPLTFRASGDFSIISGNKIIFTGEKKVIYNIINRGAGPAIFKQKEGIKVNLPADFSIKPKDPVTDSIILEKIEYARGFAWAGKEDRQYRGTLAVSLKEDGFKLINEINLEEYLYGVVPSEMMISFPFESLKAQAVIARSYALSRARHIHPHDRDGFDLCDSQHCQVYKGASNEWRRSNDAVDATRSEVLYYRDKITHPLFHSNCGGHTQSSNDLRGWGKVDYLSGNFDGAQVQIFPSSPVTLVEWLKSKPSVYCNIPKYGWEPEFRWFRLVPARFIEEKINRHKEIGKIKKIIVQKRNPSGHVHSVLIEGIKGDVVIAREHKIRRLLGIGPLRSNLFWIETKFNRSGFPEEFIFYGGGWGHGVGMCQDGAAGMADQGVSYKQILLHYYKDTEIKKLDY